LTQRWAVLPLTQYYGNRTISDWRSEIGDGIEKPANRAIALPIVDAVVQSTIANSNRRSPIFNRR
jgi:hypothetical protein